MKAVIYARQSLDRNEGRSVDDQERECRAEAARLGLDVDAVFVDKGISASRYGKTRPQWEDCKEYLREDHMLIMWEASRSSRDLEEFVTLRNHCAQVGVLVSYSGKVLDYSRGDDRFTGGLDALLAERESEQFRERVLRGKRSGALEGRPAGRVKWGYRVASPGVWEPDPVEAPKVQESVARILRGDSIYSVLLWLDTQPGYHPPTITVLHRALKSPTYAALRVYQGSVVGAGNWPPLITEAQHRQLLARARRSAVPSPSPEPKYLLSGIVKCGSCGKGVRCTKNKHGTPIYACNKGHVTRLAEMLEKRVEHRLFGAIYKANLRPDEHDDDTVAATWAKIDELDEKLEKWRTMALAEEISPESFAEFEKALTKQKKALEAQTIPAGQVFVVDPAAIVDNWKTTPLIEKRNIIRAFLAITIHPAKQGYKAGDSGIEIIDLFVDRVDGNA